MEFTKNALQVVQKRYLLRTHDGTPIETPEEMFRRVAKTLAQVEGRYGSTPEEIGMFEEKFYCAMVLFRFTPAGRTIANAGGPTPLVSNCIVLHVEDSMESIFQTLKDAALLQKGGSGLGFPLHLMRPAGSITETSYGNASGPVSFLQVYNTAFGVIKQQNRHGANMAVMRVDHPDILEFIHCKDKEGDLRNFNVSLGLTDEFMEQVATNSTKPWYCSWQGSKVLPRRITRDNKFSYQSHEDVEMTAREMFQEVVHSAWSTGEPGCVFLDTVNKVNPVPGLGRIEACNPCGEQFLHDGDVCNLGSINLESFYKDGQVDIEGLKAVTRIAVRMLDNVIDISQFSVDKVNQTFRANRRVGLGIMGFADLLFNLRIGYNTQKGRDTARLVMETIQTTSHALSEQLGHSKGVFPNWEKSIYGPAGSNTPMRNAALTNVAPTGTISMMFNVSGGVEPYFALAYYYRGVLGASEHDKSKRLYYVNKHLDAALREAGYEGDRLDQMMGQIIQKGSVRGIAELPQWVREVFVTSMDCSAEDHIQMQAAFQEHCDNAISKTINFPEDATKDDILMGYVEAWKQGCKGTTVYRNNCRQYQVLNLADDTPEDSLCPECGSVMVKTSGCSECPECAYSVCSA